MADLTEEEFLARERELLGDDALLFGNPLVESAATPAAPQDLGAFGGGNGDDGFGDFSASTAAAPADFGFTQQQQQNGYEFGNGDVFSQTQAQAHAAFPDMEFANASAVAAGIGEAEAEAEPEAVRAWRDNFELTIADRDARSAAKNEETVRAARESLDRFYAEYNDKKNKTIARNKENEKTALALQESNSGGIWEQVVKQIDTSAKDAKLKEKLKSDGKDEGKKKIAAAAGPKAKDTSRMKSLLISLKADKAAPGAEN